MTLVDTMNGGRSFGSSYPRYKGSRLFPFRSPSTKGVIERQAMKEQWKPIDGWVGLYEASDMGRIRSLPRNNTYGRVLSPSPKSKYGHLQVSLSNRKAKVRKSVHSLVALAFMGPCPSGMEICHIDGNPQNNNISNLRYGSRKSNHADSIRHGTSPGFLNSKLSDKDVIFILKSRGVKTSSQLAEKYNVHKSSIKAIWGGRNMRRFQFGNSKSHGIGGE